MRSARNRICTGRGRAPASHPPIRSDAEGVTILKRHRCRAWELFVQINTLTNTALGFIWGKKNHSFIFHIKLKCGKISGFRYIYLFIIFLKI